MTIVSPNTANTTLTPTGGPVGGITPAAVQEVTDSLAGQYGSTQTSSYTLVLADFGTGIIMNSSSPATVTVPPNSSVAFDIGTRINVFHQGTGSVSVAGGSGVTFLSRFGTAPYTTLGTGSVIYLWKINTDLWYIWGDISTQATTLTGITLSNSSFVGGSASGTIVGAITVQTTGGAFSGTLSLSGTNASSFQIVGSNLETNGTVKAGTYSLNIIATQNGATGSPYTLAVSIAGTMPVPAGTISGYSSGGVIFNDQFLTGLLNNALWVPGIADQTGFWYGSGTGYVVTSPLTSEGSTGGYHDEYFDPNQVSTGSGLALTAARYTSQGSYTWKSGCVTTHGLFTFKGGYFQCCAQMPDMTTGMWPAIWHLEGGAEVDTYDGGFNVGGSGAPNTNYVLTCKMFAGSQTQHTVNAAVDLSASYNVFALEYIPGVSMTYFFNGTQIAQDTTGVISGGMTILLTLQVASSAASGFHPYDTGTAPTPSVMKISQVQVFGLPNLLLNHTNSGPPATGTPGTWPTDWSFFNAGSLVESIIAFGTVASGIAVGYPYITTQLSGTTNTTSCNLFMTVATPLTAGVVYTLSAYVWLASGALTNVSSVSLQFDAYTSGQVFISNIANPTILITGSQTRFQASGTAPANTAFTHCCLTFNFSSGVSLSGTPQITIAGVKINRGTVADQWIT